MGKQHQPLLRNRPLVKPLALLDRAQRVQIVAHHPGCVQVVRRGDQVADVDCVRCARAGCSRLRRPGWLDMHAHHLRRVSGEQLHPDAGAYLRRGACAGQIQQRHLAALHQRVVVGREVADAVALQLQVAVLHLAAMGKVAGVGEGGGHAAVRMQRRVPAAVVEVQVGVDHNVHLRRVHAGCGIGLEQQLLVAEDLAHPGRMLVADAGLDDHGVPARAHHRGVQSQPDAVVRVRRDAPLPQRLGHHTEHGAAVQQVDAIGADGHLKVAELPARANQGVVREWRWERGWKRGWGVRHRPTTLRQAG